MTRAVSGATSQPAHRCKRAIHALTQSVNVQPHAVNTAPACASPAVSRPINPAFDDRSDTSSDSSLRRNA